MDDRLWSEDDVASRLPASVGAAGRDLVRRAYRLAEACHRGQARDDGTPYFLHPVGVCLLLIEEKGIADPEVLAAALLHDVIEESPTTADDLRSQFGDRVARMVVTLTKDKSDGPGRAERDRAYLEAVSRADTPTRLVKVADRLNSAGRLHRSPDPAKRRRYWEETRDDYLPLAQATDDTLYRKLKEWVETFRA